MAQVPSGTLIFIATETESAVAITAITNATEAVVTAAGHGLVDGDIVLIDSGWGQLNKRAIRVKDVAANNFTLERVDTTNQQVFPPGAGVGNVTKLVTWTQITTIMNPSNSGGDPRNVTYKFLESDVEFQINDGFNASSMSFSLDIDSADTAGFKALEKFTDTRKDTVLKTLLKTGTAIYQPCTLAINPNPVFTDGQIVTVSATVSGNGRAIRYSPMP
jgi:hypothetical protein